VTPIESRIIAVLKNQPALMIDGEVIIEGVDPDDVLDCIFALKKRGIVDARFLPNPNRRLGSDFGWVKLM
jgi:hypothetical protein